MLEDDAVQFHLSHGHIASSGRSVSRAPETIIAYGRRALNGQLRLLARALARTLEQPVTPVADVCRCGERPAFVAFCMGVAPRLESKKANWHTSVIELQPDAFQSGRFDW